MQSLLKPTDFRYLQGWKSFDESILCHSFLGKPLKGIHHGKLEKQM